MYTSYTGTAEVFQTASVGPTLQDGVYNATCTDCTARARAAEKSHDTECFCLQKHLGLILY